MILVHIRLSLEELKNDKDNVDARFAELVEQNESLNKQVQENEIEKVKLQGEYRLLERWIEEGKETPIISGHNDEYGPKAPGEVVVNSKDETRKGDEK